MLARNSVGHKTINRESRPRQVWQTVEETQEWHVTNIVFVLVKHITSYRKFLR